MALSMAEAMANKVFGAYSGIKLCSVICVFRYVTYVVGLKILQNML